MLTVAAMSYGLQCDSRGARSRPGPPNPAGSHDSNYSGDPSRRPGTPALFIRSPAGDSATPPPGLLRAQKPGIISNKRISLNVVRKN